MLRRTLELVSPIPPMRTGTAAYFETLVSRIAPIARSQGDVVIITDPRAMPEGHPLPESLHGVPIVACGGAPAEPGIGATRIIFLANNEYHLFAHQMVQNQSSRAMGRTIVVLHDPSMFMVHRHMTSGALPDYSTADLIDATKTQLGAAGERLVLRRMNNVLPEVFEHGVHCMGDALRVADEIWVHSLYAANRVLFENDIELGRLPRIKVCAHPHPQITDRRDRRSGGEETFRIGVFGWVTPPKRVISVLKGLSLALDRLPAADQVRLELLIVGRKPANSGYDPVSEVERLQLGDQVQFIDYPDADTFENLMATCRLIFNLRYPSCGESSGTLASAETTTARHVVSRYQSFREARGAWRYIDVAQPYEVWQIAQCILDALRLENLPEHGATTDPTSGVAPVEKLVLLEMLKQQQVMHDAELSL